MLLNEEQQRAVDHPEGQFGVILAGAGSGKTRVLQARVERLLSLGIPANRICVVTFTNKAANEIRERLEASVGVTASELVLGTIHSLALNAIRQDTVGFGLRRRISIVDEYDCTQLLKKILEREKIEDNAYHIRECIEYHRARGCGFSKDYTEEVHHKALRAHAGYHALSDTMLKVWGIFEEEKKQQSVLDFSDMLWLVLQRLAEDSEFKREWENHFSHVLVDEAQDCSSVHWELIGSLLREGNYNLLLAGDLGQSIYSFNGASPETFQAFCESWRGVKPVVYPIVRNHRSVSEIVKLANVVQSKMDTIPLKMESWRGLNGEKGTTRLIRASLPIDIAAIIANEISREAKLVRNNLPYKDNAVLVRSATQIRDIETEFVRYRIPYIIRGGRGLLATEEVRDVMSYLKFATNTRDFAALLRSVSAPCRGVGEVALEKMRTLANERFKGDLWECAKTQSKLAPYAGLIGDVKTAAPATAVDMVIKLGRYKEYVQEKYKKDQAKVKTKLENLDSFKELVESLVEERDMSLEDIVFQLSMDRNTDDEDPDGKVLISTIHALKGGEARRVYITNCYSGSLPHVFSQGSPEELAEERRIFYVAVTRARDQLVIAVPNMVRKGPNVASVAISPFLTEIGIN